MRNHQLVTKVLSSIVWLDSCWPPKDHYGHNPSFLWDD